MRGLNLRPYQLAAVEAVLKSWTKNRRTLLVIPTGGGKTLVFSRVIQRAGQQDGGRSLVLAHRDELISQACDKLQAATGIRAEREQSDHRAPRSAGVVVGSVQTLQGKRLQGWPRDHFARVIIDEAHHTLAGSYQTILAHFEGARMLGVTATPDRTDKRNLARVFDDIAFEISLIDLVRDGYLSPIKARTVPIGIDLRNVRTRAGDYDDTDLAEALAPQLGRIADVLAAEYPDRKTLVFLPRVETSETLAGLCRDRGLAAEHVDGGSRDRSDILERFSTGATRLVSNANLLVEGYDECSIDCVACLRPTKSRALYSQIVGRGTRLHPGKKELLLLDFLWLSETHSLIRPAHLIATNDAEAKDISRQMAMGDGDLLAAKDDVDEARRCALAEQLARNRHRKGRLFDALEFALSLRDVATADFEPTMRWHHEPVSEKQAARLERAGIDPTTARSKGHAWVLIERLEERRALNLASAKQAYWLAKEGHPNPETCTFAEATQWLNERWNQPDRRRAA
jgi:superfamily II DNA or RNA helicase